MSFLLGNILANATEHIIYAQGTTIPTDIFVPSVTNAVVGDTVTWIWVNGVHTTESVTIPAGAATWASDLDTNNTTFSYVVTVPGSYYYDCHPLFSHGMDGTIEVTAATGIRSTDLTGASSIYPNPFTDKITIETPHAEMIVIYNIMGQEIKSVAVQKGQSKIEIAANELTNGVYFFSIINEGVVLEVGRLVKN